ncbi:arsenate-mycothiol transferase ArsC [Halosimplex halophilum]|uniref:arsenate-mycothiol transferase ArsC n=1 Tax=Halosimplex halophilum TaxID=2559572 RepID=UPI00107F61ED|nr:low molecular weight phosphatase family protein [Halosimplex halophilum]
MSTESESTDPTRIAFVCVQNAGRSQMSAAFAERERDRRGLGDRVEILTGGTHPADRVHDGVVDAMAEVGVDLSDRTPRAITAEELRACDYVATMGCSTLDLGDAEDDVDVRDWALDDPDGEDPERVREIRDEIEDRVAALFDEFSDAGDGPGGS